MGGCFQGVLQDGGAWWAGEFSRGFVKDGGALRVTMGQVSLYRLPRSNKTEPQTFRDEARSNWHGNNSWNAVVSFGRAADFCTLRVFKQMRGRLKSDS